MFVVAHEPLIRAIAFFGLFAVFGIAEAWAPKRDRAQPRRLRWLNNLAIVGISGLAVRLLAPMLPVGMALWAAESDVGLLNRIAVPGWLAVIASVVLLDLLIWVQHVAFHKVPVLWRLHRMHHADVDIDVTTGARFHPVEILLSLLIKLGAVALLGAPAAAVVLFEVLLNGTAMFNHANLALPRGLDRVLRLLVVTPDMHRIHHSWHGFETDSNYGFNFPWWDRLFRTYRDQPVDGYDGMTIGLHRFRDARDQWLHRLLIQPLLRG